MLASSPGLSTGDGRCAQLHFSLAFVSLFLGYAAAARNLVVLGSDVIDNGVVRKFETGVTDAAESNGKERESRGKGACASPQISQGVGCEA